VQFDVVDLSVLLNLRIASHFAGLLVDQVQVDFSGADGFKKLDQRRFAGGSVADQRKDLFAFKVNFLVGYAFTALDVGA
jgi:hypothetical protein